MKRLSFLFPAAIALGLTGCGDDTTGAGTEGDGSTSTTGETATETASETMPTSGPSTDTEPTSTTDPTVDPDTGSESSDDGGTDCTPDDECQVAEDCGAGFNCLGCLCVEDNDPNNVCPGGWGDGEYNDCVADGNDVCTSTSGLTPGCVVDDPANATTGVCFFGGCTDACDCPAPPDPAFESQVACEDIIGGEGEGDCFIDCSGGAACPEGMFCFAGALCFHGDGGGDGPGYGDCVNEPPCGSASEVCLSDNPMDPGIGFCSSGCMSEADCAEAPETGDAPVTCADLTGDEAGNCFLDCSMGQTCPDGMECAFDSFCAWPAMPESGYADCATQPDTVCIGGETCIETTNETNGTTQVCAAADCVDPVADCPPVPETGDAPAACQDIDGNKGDECVLDCSMGQTCPDGAICTEDGFCSYELPTFTFSEDFQGGVLPKGWTVHNVDGLTPNDMVAVVDDAWVVTDEITADGDFWAVSTSWYEPVGMADDWIISPAITLAATATLQWSAFTVNGMFPDGYEVYVVPTSVTEFTDFVTSGDPTDFLALDPVAVPSAEPVFAIEAEEATPQFRTVDLAALAGEEVHLVFRNNTDDALLLLIDNIAVIE